MGASGPWDLVAALLGPDPFCMSWFITSIANEYLRHQRVFLYIQEKDEQERAKTSHHTIPVDSLGTRSNGLHLRSHVVLTGTLYLNIKPSSNCISDFYISLLITPCIARTG